MRPVQDPEHGQVACMGKGEVALYAITFPVRPLTRLRMRRVLKADWAAFDLRVIESSVKLARPKVFNAPVERTWRRRSRLLGKGVTQAIHRFETTGAAGEWNSAQLDFTTNLNTRTLIVLFEDLDRPAGSSSAEACLAELSLERVRATPRQEMLLERSGANSRDTGNLGLVKRGRLLPAQRVRVAKPPYDENYEHVDALFAPAPTRLRFPLEIPDGGRLTFSYSLGNGSHLGDAASFEVSLGQGAERKVIFSEEVSIGEQGEGWHWRRAEVDLTRWAGQSVDLELATRSDGPRGFALWGNPMVDSPRRPEDPPNVVLIGIDTLRADRLSVYGYPRATSPNLDRLAADGVVFEQAISAANWTAPSFASIFTGRVPATHGLVNAETAVSSQLDTLAERLRSGGWRTHAVVYKAFLFGLGLDRGFDRWFNLPTSRRTAQTNLDKALDWLDAHREQRFFLFLHLDDPHQPFNQPHPFDLEFGDAVTHEKLGLELPISITRSGISGCPGCFRSGRPEPDFVAAAQNLYDGAIAYTDDRIGVLLDALREWGIYNDTVIAVVSDHGEVIYDRGGAWGHGATVLTDSMVRVPLVVKPAGGEQSVAGRRISTQVRTTDLLPTVLEAAGLDPGEGPDSRSLWPLVDGDEVGDRVAFVENPARSVIGVRTGRWKYVARFIPGAPVVGRLFDLEADPDELVAVGRENPEAMSRMEELLAGFLLRTRPGPFVVVTGDGEPGPWTIEVESDGELTHRTLVGLPITAGQPGIDNVPGRTGTFLALVQLEASEDVEFAVSLQRGGETLVTRKATSASFVDYRGDGFEELIQRAQPSISLLRGPSPLAAGRSTTNLDQLEDLKALGYIE